MSIRSDGCNHAGLDEPPHDDRTDEHGNVARICPGCGHGFPVRDVWYEWARIVADECRGPVRGRSARQRHHNRQRRMQRGRAHLSRCRCEALAAGGTR